MPHRLARLWPLLPLVGVGIFIAIYATATPLTDEWLFLRGAMRFSEAHTLREMWDSLVFGIYDHIVVVPFVFVYLPLGFATGFDQRALIVVTVLCHASVLYAVVRRYAPPPFVLFCASLLLFSPARHAEFLWGFEFTLALSIALPVWALFVCDRLRPGHGPRALAARLALILALLVLGAGSSAGGYLGFPAAMVVIALKKLELRMQIVFATVLGVIGCALYFALKRGGSDLSFAWSDALVASASAGTAIVSSGVAASESTLDARTLLGGVFLVIAAAAVVRALKLRLLDELAFAIGLVVYGVLAVFAVAFNRHYSTNWHVQLVLPAFVGTLVLAWFTRQKRRAVVDRCLWIGACTLALLGSVGWLAGCRAGGPQFHAYVREIERYIVTYESNPNQPKPFPTTRLWDIDRDMITFLRSQNHPVFSAPDRRSAAR